MTRLTFGGSSNSCTVRAKLLTSGRTFIHDNCGEIFVPKQLGNSAVLVKPTLGGTSPPSSKVVELMWNWIIRLASAPFAMEVMHHTASAVAPAALRNFKRRLSIICSSHVQPDQQSVLIE